MANVLRSGCLEERKVPILKASNAEKVVEATGFMKEPVRKKLTSKGHKLPANIQSMMAPKSKDHTWPSPTPAGLFQSVCATEWVFSYFGKGGQQCNINQAWLSVLAGTGWMVAQRSTGALIKVVAGNEYSFLGWKAEAQSIPQNRGETCYVLPPAKECISFHHIIDLEDWIVVPTKPLLLTESRGPLGWKKDGEPRSLQAKVCLEGCTVLTNPQLTALIRHLGGQIASNSTRRARVEMLIKMCLPESEQARALAMLGELEKQKAQDVDDDEIDSQFSELLSDLDKEEGDQQDIKDWKDKKKKLRAKRKLAARDAPVQPKKKSKGKGRGKGNTKGRKGKGKGKRGGKAKAATGKESFMQNFAREEKKMMGRRGVMR